MPLFSLLHTYKCVYYMAIYTDRGLRKKYIEKRKGKRMKRRAILLGSNFVLVVILAIFTTLGVSAHRAGLANKLSSISHRQQSKSFVRRLPSDGINLASHKPTDASSVDIRYPSSNAVDGDLTTRWSSEIGGHGKEWLQIDLGNLYFINKVNLYWERAYATSYQI